MRQGLSLSLGLAISARPATSSLLDPPVPDPQCWGGILRHTPPLLAFYVRARDLNSGPHACPAGSLFTRLSLQCLFVSFFETRYLHITPGWFRTTSASRVLKLHARTTPGSSWSFSLLNIYWEATFLKVETWHCVFGMDSHGPDARRSGPFESAPAHSYSIFSKW